jgi:hypothetical protein
MALFLFLYQLMHLKTCKSFLRVGKPRNFISKNLLRFELIHLYLGTLSRGSISIKQRLLGAWQDPHHHMQEIQF